MYCFRQYGSQWEYEVRAAGGPWPPPKQNPNAYFGHLIAFLFLTLGLVHFIFMFHSLKIRKILILQNSELEYKYQEIRSIAHSKSNNKQYIIENINSAKELSEYLARKE